MTSGIEPASKPAARGIALQSPSLQDRPQKSMKRKRFTRLVSQDELGSACTDKVKLLPAEDGLVEKENTLLPNLLTDSSLTTIHVASLRLEAELHPLRTVLARLMIHPTYNRKGLFNQPVDPVALKLPDYHLVVSRPMDLGTVKKRLHAVAYRSRKQAAEDIRLVFTNSMRYNPPHNFVHQCASNLLGTFEEAYKALDSVSSNLPIVPSFPRPLVRSVSSTSDEKSRDTCSPAAITPLHGAASLSATVVTAQSHPCGEQSSLQKCSSSSSQPVVYNPAANSLDSATPVAPAKQKRKSRLPPFLPHTCQSCQGRKCSMCMQGCLFHEPALIVCEGVHCGGAKVRKGSVYFVTKDGQRHFCQRCYTNLTPVLPNAMENDPCRYKQDLLKRKNDEEIAEAWINCSKCSAGVHAICAMHNSFTQQESAFVCVDCQEPVVNEYARPPVPGDAELFTFISGDDTPVAVPLSKLSSTQHEASSLPQCAVSAFIEAKVKARMKTVPNAEKTISVRLISDCSRQFSVPDVVRRHFRMAAEADSIVKPPSQVRYRQKAITLFQKIDGLDVCIFCMYVQEYDGDDDYDNETEQVKSNHSKRVYIAYLDSVEHFRPRECRTEVYQEILVSYLATARARGYETAQIWACPPSRGNSFVFWNHPASQRTPTHERLITWYHGALSRAIGCGVVTDVKSLFESDFQGCLEEIEREANAIADQCQVPSGRMVCPPLLDGDFWIDEAVRLHTTNISRNLKVRAPTEVCVWNVSPLKREELDSCPSLQVATLVKDRIMTHPSSVPFRRPVNAASMKLKNYHKIVTKPMDLGTIYSHCVIGEYHTLSEVVADIKLMVANAKKFNPVGHFVHTKADEIQDLFFQELGALIEIWASNSDGKNQGWEEFADMSMSLDKSLDLPAPTPDIKSSSVVIEDDRSSDGSRSTFSSISIPSSPLSRAGSLNDDTTLQKPRKTARVSLSVAPKSPRSRTAKKMPPRKLCLHSDGPEAVFHRTVGEDVWLLDKRNPAPPKGARPSMKTNNKRRRSLSFADSDEAPPKRRRQSWLGEEIGNSVRRMRTSFFACSLTPKDNMTEMEQEKSLLFQEYIDEFDSVSSSTPPMTSPITDARHTLLEFSQYRHLEFDTLRRAKHSTSLLLYHLKNKGAPGVVPMCTSCDEAIDEIRWHKVKKVTEKRRVTKNPALRPSDPPFLKEELCGCCHEKHSSKDDFIPIPVSLKRV